MQMCLKPALSFKKKKAANQRLLPVLMNVELLKGNSSTSGFKLFLDFVGFVFLNVFLDC